ncbi:chemotaxis protein [Thaumasiovibrio subtropicus]|uniref:chemotaxis protein n=1 Tax=Thaumasiovibrio subtropicus TaxID=1891207 RepID=UPI000B3546F8|nr:chemotaxis protein [Thaumasiovibrio subtropicus]
MLKNATNASQGMLLFSVSSLQKFAMGTLKIKEIVPYRHLTQIPHSHPNIIGAANMRGVTIPVIDMAKAIGYRAISEQERENCSIIITDCRNLQVGFLVRSIDKIVSFDWKQIESPPNSLGENVFVTGVMNVGDNLVQLLDVELILSTIYPDSHDALHPVLTDLQRETLRPLKILLVDDSAVARRQLTEALESISIPYFVASNGQDALNIMRHAAKGGAPVQILVSDIEMPGLDGYELAFEVQNSPELNRTYVILHTSLSSHISVSQAKQVGAHEALTKFNADELIHAMLRGAEAVSTVDA